MWIDLVRYDLIKPGWKYRLLILMKILWTKRYEGKR